MFESASVPENLFPVPSKQRMNFLRCLCGNGCTSSVEVRSSWRGLACLCDEGGQLPWYCRAISKANQIVCDKFIKGISTEDVCSVSLKVSKKSLRVPVTEFKAYNSTKWREKSLCHPAVSKVQVCLRLIMQRQCFDSLVSTNTEIKGVGCLYRISQGASIGLAVDQSTMWWHDAKFLVHTASWRVSPSSAALAPMPDRPGQPQN